MAVEYDPEQDSEPSLPERSILVAAAQSYLSAGFSIIPVGLPNKANDPKAPHACAGQTARWLKVAPDVETVRSWLQHRLWGWGVVSGQIVLPDGKVVYATGYDFDDALFIDWMLNTPVTLAFLQSTWAYRTGRGYLHFWVLSEEPTFSSVQNIGSRHICDVRGVGKNGSNSGYLIAPPSVHPNGGSYTPLYGGPDEIRLVPNAGAVFQRILEQYQHGITITQTRDHTIRPPLEGEARDALLARVRGLETSDKIRRAITHGAHVGEGEWRRTSGSSDSEIDFAVVSTLVKCGWSESDIEDVYATFQIGENCYRQRRAGGGSVGSAYLQTTLRNAGSRVEEETEEARTAHGRNFKVVKVIKHPGDRDVPYTFFLETSGGTINAHLSTADIQTHKHFQLAFYREAHFMPDVLPVHTGGGWSTGFLSAIRGVMDIEDIPDEATQAGHLRSTILNILRSSQIRPEKPEIVNAMTLGWHVGDHMEIRGDLLINNIRAALSDAKPEAIWREMRTFHAIRHMTDVRGRAEQVWVIPLRGMEN